MRLYMFYDLGCLISCFEVEANRKLCLALAAKTLTGKELFEFKSLISCKHQVKQKHLFKCLQKSVVC